MSVVLQRAFCVTCLFVLAGCVTDEPVVFQDHVVGTDAAKRFLGDYEVVTWPGSDAPERIQVTEHDGKLRFAYSIPNQKIQLNFILSKIPKSKKKLYLLAVPTQNDTNQANVFFIGKAGKDQTSLWAVVGNLPVAKEHLSFSNGKAKAADVKAFLTKHADDFVAANQPQVKLAKTGS